MSSQRYKLTDPNTTDNTLGEILGFSVDTEDGKNVYRFPDGKIVGHRESPEVFVLTDIWRGHVIGRGNLYRVDAEPQHETSN
jgi:hypothetical protein